MSVAMFNKILLPYCPVIRAMPSTYNQGKCVTQKDALKWSSNTHDSDNQINSLLQVVMDSEINPRHVAMSHSTGFLMQP